jgi:exopolysaccharide biosynthesis polyprenyl glycosylphosphotransferase
VGRRERLRLRQLGLLLADVGAINLGIVAAYVLRYELELGGAVGTYNHVPYSQYAPWGLALTGILVAAYWLEGLYRPRPRGWLDALAGIATGTIVGMALFILLLFGLRPPAPQSRLMLPYAAVLIILLVGLVRWVDQLVTRRQRLAGRGVSDTVVVGAGEVGRAVMRNIMAQPESGLRVIGFLDDDPAKQQQPIGRFEALGATTDLGRILTQRPVDEVVVALPWQCREQIMTLADTCEAAGVNLRIVPDLFQMSLNRVDLDSLNGIPLIAVREPTIRGWHFRLKRALDVAVSGLGLVLLSPILAGIALAIKLDSPGPVLFRQVRVGRDGRLFTCFKFRSMVDGAAERHDALRPYSQTTGPIFKMKDDPRLTRVGRWLRRTSADELPQLLNILRGEMSLVGPRPPMPSEVAEYEDWHRRRLEVAPGLTGLWQVSGRSELTFDEMVMLDLFYAENWSLGLDLKILLQTVPTVILGTGAY